jgi:hypothetical protein
MSQDNCYYYLSCVRVAVVCILASLHYITDVLHAVSANAFSRVQLRQDYEHIIMLCAGTGITPMLQLSRCHINQQRQLVRSNALSYAITRHLVCPVHSLLLLRQ